MFWNPLRGDGLKHFKKAALSEPTTTWFWEGWETCCLGNYKIVFSVLDPACNQTTEKIPPTTVVVTPSIDESVSGPRAPSNDDQTGNVHAFDKTQSMQNFHTRPTIRGFPGFYCQTCHKTIIILSLNSSTHSIVPQVLCCVRLDALRPVYTCDFWCDFWCDFACKTRLTLPCTNAFFAKHRVDWKESYHILFEDTLHSNFC